MSNLRIEYRATAGLLPYAMNARTHSASQVDEIARSIQEFGFTNPVLIDKDGMIIAGHGRVMAANQLGLDKVPCITLGYLSDRQKRAYILADNRIALNAGWDLDKLAKEISDLSDLDYDVTMLGFSEQEIDAILQDQVGLLPDNFDGPEQTKTSKLPDSYSNKTSGALFQKFIYPPFSVLNTMSGPWQERKKMWTSRVGDFGESRTGALGSDPIMMSIGNGVSILDGCLAELIVRWFAKEGWKAFDPFAGDTVFGYVAATLGLEFTGIELRQEQALLNQARVDRDGLKARYINDDAVNLGVHIPNKSQDLIFTCPPYSDLEVYSDDPRDLSTMETKDFLAVYRKVLRSTYLKLKPNRFAVVVVGEVRSKEGDYINLVGETVTAMVAAGYKYYNEIVLYTSAGTLPIRAGRVFNSSRKIGKTHQNVLVFFKGDMADIKNEFGEVIAEGEYEEEGGGESL